MSVIILDGVAGRPPLLSQIHLMSVIDNLRHHLIFAITHDNVFPQQPWRVFPLVLF